MTAISLQTIVDRARVYLFDDDKVRDPDSECLNHIKWGLHKLRERRADLFIGQLTIDIEALTLTSPWPLQNEFEPAFEDLIIARAMSKDNEAALQARAMAFFQLAGLGD